MKSSKMNHSAQFFLGLRSRFGPGWDQNIHTIFHLDSAPSETGLLAALHNLISLEPKFTCTVSDAQWKPIPAFDIREHVFRTTRLKDLSDLNQLNNRLLTEGLAADGDHSQAMWRVHLVTYESSKQVDVLFRIWHGLGDGERLTQLVLQSLEEEPLSPVELRDAALSPVARNRKKGAGIGVVLVSALIWIWSWILAIFNTTRGFCKVAVVPLYPKQTLFSDPAVSGKTLISSSVDIPLAEVKRVSKMQKCSVSVVLFALFSEALEGVLQKSSKESVPKNVLATVAFSVRSRPFLGFIHYSKLFGADDSNMHGFTLIPYVVRGPKNFLERLRTINREMVSAVIENMHHITIFFDWMTYTFFGAAAMTESIVSLGNRVLLNLSSVRGPQAPIRIGGSRVTRIVAQVHPSICPFLVTFFSYADNVTVSITGWKECSPNLTEFADRILEASASMSKELS